MLGRTPDGRHILRVTWCEKRGDWVKLPRQTAVECIKGRLVDNARFVLSAFSDCQFFSWNSSSRVKMKVATILAAACATVVLAEPKSIKPRALTIEVAPGVTRQITEDERYELSAVRL